MFHIFQESSDHQLFLNVLHAVLYRYRFVIYYLKFYYANNTLNSLLISSIIDDG